MAPLPNNLSATRHALAARALGGEKPTIIALGIGMAIIAIGFVIGMAIFISCWCTPSRSIGHRSHAASDDVTLVPSSPPSQLNLAANKRWSADSLAKPQPVMGQFNLGHTRVSSREPLFDGSAPPVTQPAPVADVEKRSTARLFKESMASKLGKVRKGAQ